MQKTLPQAGSFAFRTLKLPIAHCGFCLLSIAYCLFQLFSFQTTALQLPTIFLSIVSLPFAFLPIGFFQLPILFPANFQLLPSNFCVPKN
jgi:hypothetical protein